MRGPLQGNDVMGDIEEELRKKRKTADIDFTQVLPRYCESFFACCSFFDITRQAGIRGIGLACKVLIMLGKRLI